MNRGESVAEWFKCPVALVDSDELTGSEKLVMLSLLRHMGQNDVCWPSLSRIGDETRLSRKWVIETLKDLEAKGIIAITKTPRRANQYRIVSSVLSTPPSVLSTPPSVLSTPEVVNSVHPNYINRNRYKKQIKEIEEPRPKFRGQPRDPDRPPSWAEVMPAWAERMGLTEEDENYDSE